MSEQATAPAAASGAGDAAIVVADKTATDVRNDAGQAPADKTKPADSGTVLTSDAAGDAPVAVQTKWRDDWRETMAGGDEKFLAHLKRYTTPENYAKAGYEAQQKIRSGELKKQLPADAAPEDVAAWRKENGIPEKPEGYEIKLASGIVPGEDDKPVIDSFRQFAHAKNLTPAQFNEMADWYYNEQEQNIVRQQQTDKSVKQATEDELRQEWGGNYRSNINAMKNFLAATASEDVANNIFGARLANGNLFGNDAAALKWLEQVAREQLPGAGLVPSGIPNVGKGVEDRIAEIEKVLRTDRAAYFKDQRMQDEYQGLIAARDKMKARAA